jgi:PPK2 family polyphosphate:nucleotide phosphotransferase
MTVDKWRIRPEKKVVLSTIPTTLKSSRTEKELKSDLKDVVDEISALQNQLYAENRQSLLLIFQGMDSSGKDSAIRKVLRGINPQGFTVTSFKHPTALELEHDFLWRHTLKLPEHGQIAVFNRSWYENVLISRVHPELVLAERLREIVQIRDIDKAFWDKRFRQINAFEQNCMLSGTQIVKIFLHLSKEEQRNRFLERIENREKHWKFAAADVAERAFWPEYELAYEEMFHATSTKESPWYIVPADHKPTAHLLVAKIILETLKKMDPQFPEVSEEERLFMERARRRLEEEEKKRNV